MGVLAATALLQVVALLARSEAWHMTIGAAGGTVERRVLFRASSMQVLGGVFNGHLGVAARIAALRRSSPEVCPQVPTLIAAEFPIIAIEAALAALASFTLIGPLGLPWWLPLILFAVIGAASVGLRHLALRKGRDLWKGLAVLRSASRGRRVVAFVLVAVFAQIFRNWILLQAVGVDASLLDATAVLIALVTLSQLPIGPGVGAAAAVLILGSDGVAATAAAGVLTDGDGNDRRIVLRGLGGRRQALGRQPQDRARRREIVRSSCRISARLSRELEPDAVRIVVDSPFLRELVDEHQAPPALSSVSIGGHLERADHRALAHRDAEPVGVAVDEDLDRVVGPAVAVADSVRHQLADEQTCRGCHRAGDDTLRAGSAVSASFRRGLQICWELDLATPLPVAERLVVGGVPGLTGGKPD